MRVLVTGSLGYLGPVVVDTLLEAGHDVVGLDSGLFAECTLEALPRIPVVRRDIRDAVLDDVRDFAAIVHLAALSNDPVGLLNPALTAEINTTATLHLARLARTARVGRFVFASTCSVYGAATEPWVDEASIPRPVTPYGVSKVEAERGLLALASEQFAPLCLRNATAFGYAPNLRADVVVNDLAAAGYLAGRVALSSDGSAWRPLVHVRDIAQAVRLALAMPARQISGQVVNVGAETQNFTILEVAQRIAAMIPGSQLVVPPSSGSDRRSYRVRFDRIAKVLPEFRCEVGLDAGVAELLAGFRRIDLRSVAPLVRLGHVRRLLETGRLDDTLRVRAEVVTGLPA